MHIPILLLLIFSNFHVSAKNNVISSYETELNYAFGGATYGLFAKVNHQWTKKNTINFQTGISSAFFMESNSLTTDYYKRKGVLFDPHINANSGIIINLLKTKIQIGLNLFGGYYILKKQGKYKSSILTFSQDKYMNQTSYFNWGTRLTFAYKITEQISLQLSSNNSFNEWMIFSGEDYSKLFYGIGIIFKP